MPDNHIAILDGHHPDELGLLPSFIDQSDPRPAAEQFDANYHQGWRPMSGFTHKGVVLRYPGYPPYMPVAMWPLRNELIVVYRFGLVAIFNTKTEAFQVSRID